MDGLELLRQDRGMEIATQQKTREYSHHHVTNNFKTQEYFGNTSRSMKLAVK